MNKLESDLLAQVTLDEPWGLVESFATFKREHPTDVNRGMDEVVSRLRKHGVDVTVHEPSLYLRLPGQARVEAGGKTFRAKPPAYSLDARSGMTGQIVYVGARHNAMIEDMFEAVGPVTIRRMFGGKGIYARGIKIGRASCRERV